MKNPAGFTLIELLIVVGIFTLAAGMSLLIISSSRLSVDVNEARIQAQEHARKAMNQLSKELRLSNPFRMHIYTNLTTLAPLSGPVIYFQIPLELASGALDLTPSNALRWGAKDSSGGYTENNFIYYYVNNNQLMRDTANAQGAGVAGAGAVIARNISSISFSRADTSSPLVTVEINGESDFKGQAITQTLRSNILLRNAN